MPKPKTPDQMTEAELADYYQQQKGDVSLWSKTPRRIRRRRGQGPSTSFAVRLTATELEVLNAAAGRAGTTLSDFIRSSSLTAARSNGPRAADADSALTTGELSDLRRALKEIEASIEDALRVMENTG